MPARALEASLTLAERARLSAIRVQKRRDDWVAGRLTAKAVVAAALASDAGSPVPGHAIEIASEPGGMPYARVAPEAAPVSVCRPGERLPICVSISHTERHVASAAVSFDAVDGGTRRTLGIDLGLVEPRSREFLATFFTDDERRFVSDGDPDGRDARANLVWCAKEAVLKALGVGLTVDTALLSCRPETLRAESIAHRTHPAEGAWRAFAASCSPALVAGGGIVNGLWIVLGRFVVALAIAEPPASWLAGKRNVARCRAALGG